jgi:MFS family permease
MNHPRGMNIPFNRIRNISGSKGLSAGERRLLLALMIPNFLLLMMEGMVGVALPSIQKEFGISVSLLSWVIAAAWLGRVPLATVFGSLGDMLGAKRILLLGIGVYSLGTLVGSVTTGFISLLVGRFLQGVGSATFPLAMAPIIQSFPNNRRGQALGFWNIAAPMAIVSAPVAGGLLIEWQGWRSVFVVMTIVSSLALLFITYYIPRMGTLYEKRSIDWVGMFSWVVGLAGILLAVSADSFVSFSSAIKLGVWIGSILAIGIFLSNHKRNDNSILDRAILTNRSFFIPALAVNLRMIALDGGRFLLILFFANIFELTPRSIGAYLLAYSVPLLISVPLGGVLADRLQRRKLGPTGLVLQACGLLWIGVSSSESSLILVSVGIVISSLGAGIALISFSKEALGALGGKRVGLASGLYETIRFLGVAVTPPLLGLLLTRIQQCCGRSMPIEHPYLIGFRLLALVAILGSIVAAVMPHRPSEMRR